MKRSSIKLIAVLALGLFILVPGAVPALGGENAGDQDDFLSYAPAPLSVSTSPASNISAGSAELNGNLTSLGGARSVSVSFEFGTTTAYGSSIAGNPASLTSPGSFKANVSALEPGAVCHFRAKAVGLTTVYGADRSFTVPAEPPTVLTSAASSVGSSAAVLNGNLLALGSSPSVNLSFDYGTNTKLSSSIVAIPGTATTQGTFTASLAGLTPNAIYYFRAKAAGAVTSYGATLTFATSPRPEVVTNSATTVGTTVAVLHGDLISPGSAASVLVSFEYGLTNKYGSTIAGVPASLSTAEEFTANLAALKPNTLYHFRARADGDGTVYGADRTFQTLAFSLPVVTTSPATNVGVASATLNGSLNGLGADSVSVSFEYGLTSNYGSNLPGVPSSLTSAGTFTANLAGLMPNTLYHFRARATGNGTVYGADRTFTTSAGLPEVVTNSASNVSATGAVLNASLSGLGNAASASLFFDYGPTNAYSASLAGIPAVLTNPGSFSAGLNGLSASTTYHYRARAVASTATVYGADRVFTTAPAPAPAPVGQGFFPGAGGSVQAQLPIPSLVPGSTNILEKSDNSGVFYVDTYAGSDDSIVTLLVKAGIKGITSSGGKLTNVTILPVKDLPSPPTGARAVFAYDLGPTGSSFSRPAVLELDYGKISLPAGADPYKLFIASWNPAAGTWVKEGGEIDAVKAVIVCPVEHFSIFGLFYPAEPPAPATAAAPATVNAPDTAASLPTSSARDLTSSPTAAASTGINPPAAPSSQTAPPGDPAARDPAQVQAGEGDIVPLAGVPAPNRTSWVLVLSIGLMGAISLLNYVLIVRRRTRRPAGLR